MSIVPFFFFIKAVDFFTVISSFLTIVLYWMVSVAFPAFIASISITFSTEGLEDVADTFDAGIFERSGSLIVATIMFVCPG